MNNYGNFDPWGQPVREPRHRSSLPLTVLIVSIAVLLIAVMRFGNRSWIPDGEAATPRPIAPRGDLSGEEQETISIFDRCSPSVVYVSSVNVTTRRSIFGFADRVVERGTGSGFVWDTAGHIVTNFHVIFQAQQLVVTLPDNTSYEAQVVGAWPDKDIAVLRIDAPTEKLVPISVGTSHDLRVGQKVFAIGNPFGLDFTLTTGVVSALNREIEAMNGRKIHGVIQTDAAINPGNSGGPLLDSSGRLIGMNTAIYSNSGAYSGIGFAVPVDTVNDVVPQLITHGRVIRPGLGVEVASDEISRRLGVRGLLILSVTAGSGAELAGLQPTTLSRSGRVQLGDVITAIDDTKVATNDDLLTALEKYQVGDTVKVTVQRSGKSVAVPVTLQAIK